MREQKVSWVAAIALTIVLVVLSRGDLTSFMRSSLATIGVLSAAIVLLSILILLIERRP